MKRLLAVAAVAIVALVGGSPPGASAEPDPATRGCQTVALKYLTETAPGHEGISIAANQGTGEGPCGFGEPPRP